MNILIVDDDVHITSALADLLECNNTVQVANNGRDALRLFKENRHDVVITDIRMPKMDGMELLKAIRGMDDKVGLIIISAYMSEMNRDEAAKLGVDACFPKPFDVEGLMDVLSGYENGTGCA